MPLAAPPVTRRATFVVFACPSTSSRSRSSAPDADTSQVTSADQVTVTSMFCPWRYVSAVPSPSASKDGLEVIATDLIVGGSGVWSSLRIVPVAVDVAVTRAEVPDTLSATVNVSSDSSALSSIVATVKLCVSPAVPAKLIPAVFAL